MTNYIKKKRNHKRVSSVARILPSTKIKKKIVIEIKHVFLVKKYCAWKSIEVNCCSTLRIWGLIITQFSYFANTIIFNIYFRR